MDFIIDLLFRNVSFEGNAQVIINHINVNVSSLAPFGDIMDESWSYFSVELR